MSRLNNTQQFIIEHISCYRTLGFIFFLYVHILFEKLSCIYKTLTVFIELVLRVTLSVNVYMLINRFGIFHSLMSGYFTYFTFSTGLLLFSSIIVHMFTQKKKKKLKVKC